MISYLSGALEAVKGFAQGLNSDVITLSEAGFDPMTLCSQGTES